MATSFIIAMKVTGTGHRWPKNRGLTVERAAPFVQIFAVQQDKVACWTRSSTSEVKSAGPCFISFDVHGDFTCNLCSTWNGILIPQSYKQPTNLSWYICCIILGHYSPLENLRRNDNFYWNYAPNLSMIYKCRNQGRIIM